MNPSPKTVTLIALACMLALGGCQRGLELAPVSGTVTLDDQPVADAAVMFSPVGGGPVATSTTDAQGKYQLHTTNDSGATLGEHRVTVTKQEIGNLVNGVAGPGGLKITWLVPEKYSRPDTSNLKATVQRGQNEIPLKLVSQPE